MSPRAKSLKSARTACEAAPGQPLVLAAKDLLQPRFERLTTVLTEAIAAPAEEPEAIHRLRVATRRSATAVETLASVIPTDLRQPLLRQLKKLRRACGPARDLDIQQEFYEHLLAEVETRDLAVVDLLYERVTIARDKLHPELQLALERRRKKLQRAMDDVIAHLEILRERSPDIYGSLSETACPLLSRALTRVCEQTPAQDSSPDVLHNLRIAGKKLRYACELFEPLLGADFADTLAPHLIALQDELGIYHDAEVARQDLARLRLKWKRKRHRDNWDQKPQGLFSWKELAAGLKYVTRVHSERAAQARERFLMLWPSFSTTAFRQPLEKRLQRLAHPSPPSPTAPRARAR